MTKKSDSKSPSPTDRIFIIQQAATVVVLAASYCLWDRFVVPRWGLNHLGFRSVSERLIWAVRLQLPALWTLAIAVAYVIYLRCINPSARNPLAGNEHLVQVGNKVLTNTVEQWLLHLGNSLLLASWLDESQLRLLPLLSFLFFVGRIAFMVGYHINPNYREFGWWVTFVPTVVALGYNSWFLWALGASTRLG